MIRRLAPIFPLLVLVLAVAGCERARNLVTPSADPQALNAAIERRLGGPDTCVVLAETASGEIDHQYGRQAICMRRLPPCSTFEIANSLIGLDLGLVQPGTVYRWDGRRQQVRAWERDADMAYAFRASVVWWFQRLASRVGAGRYAERLQAFDYGNADVSGPATGFWLGPAEGGALAVSAREQAAFLHRLYSGRLPVKPEAAAAVEGFMREDRSSGGVELSGKTGTCRSSADGQRQSGWWVGRLRTADRDLVFAAVVDGENAPPGSEVRQRLEHVFADVGYLQPR